MDIKHEGDSVKKRNLVMYEMTVSLGGGESVLLVHLNWEQITLIYFRGHLEHSLIKDMHIFDKNP